MISSFSANAKLLNIESNKSISAADKLIKLVDNLPSFDFK